MFEIARKLNYTSARAALSAAALVVAWSSASFAGEAEEPSQEKPQSTAAALRPRTQSPIFARATYNAPGDTDGDLSATVGSMTADAGVTVPIYRGETVGLLVGTGYRFDRFHVDIADAPLPRVDGDRTFNLHRIPANMMIDLSLGGRVSLLASGGVVVAGDFKASDGDVVQPTGLVLATYAFHDRHAVTFGGGVSYQFFDLVPFPLLGYTYTSENKGFRIDALLPLAAMATVSVGWELDVSVYGRFEGLVWQTEAASSSQSFLYKMQSARAGMAIRRALVGPVGLTLDGGAHVYRRMSLRTDATTQYDVDIEPSPYFSVSVDVLPQ